MKGNCCCVAPGSGVITRHCLQQTKTATAIATTKTMITTAKKQLQQYRQQSLFQCKRFFSILDLYSIIQQKSFLNNNFLTFPGLRSLAADHE